MNEEFKIFVVIFIVVIIVLIIIGVFVEIRRINNIDEAIEVAFLNDEFCKAEPSQCVLSVDNTLPQPTEFTEDFSYELARYNADLIARVELFSSGSITSLVMPPGMVNVQTLTYKDNVIGFVGKTSNQGSDVFWVVYRGTVTSEEWEEDFTFSQSNFSNVKGEQIPGGTGVLCHKGFTNVYDSTKENVKSALVKGNATTVVTTGHSLGAAVATLAAIDLAPTYTITNYTFASPRVCNGFDTSNMTSFYRILNEEDLVPDMPLSVMPNFDTITAPYFYNHEGKAVTFSDQRFSIEQQHLLPAYINAITNFNLSLATPIPSP